MNYNKMMFEISKKKIERKVPAGCSLSIRKDEETYIVGERQIAQSAYGTYVLGDVCCVIKTEQGFYNQNKKGMFVKSVKELLTGILDEEFTKQVAEKENIKDYQIIHVEIVPLMQKEFPHYALEVLD